MKWDAGQKKVTICQVEDKTRWLLKEDQEEPGQGWVSERSWLALHAMDVPSNSVCIQQSTRGPSTERCQQAADCTRLCSCLVAQSCPILCNLIDCSPPGSLSMGFPRQEYWRGLPFSSPGYLPDPESEPRSPILQADSLQSEPPVRLVILIVSQQCPNSVWFTWTECCIVWIGHFVIKFSKEMQIYQQWALFY